MLYYRTYVLDNSKPWVTFIHGAGGSSTIWYKQTRAYKKHFNILLVDLRGHGQSGKGNWTEGDHFTEIGNEVIEVMDLLKIKESHFVGISLGTIVIQAIAKTHSKRVTSMVLGGAITELNIRTQFLISVANLTKYILPYMLLYRLFAWIIMPAKRHQESRTAFVMQAKKMCQNEFIKWLTLTRSVNPYLIDLQENVFKIPTLYVMGEEDHLFIRSVKALTGKVNKATVMIIKEAGHVCNIDQPDDFNKITIDYIAQQQFEKAS